MKFLLLFVVCFSYTNADGFETIKKESFPNVWAFSVNELQIGCEMNLPVVFLENDYMALGLTGESAKAVGRGIYEIWEDDKNIKGLKQDLRPFIEIANKHCKTNS